MPIHLISAIVFSILVLVGKISKKNPIIALVEKILQKITLLLCSIQKSFLTLQPQTRQDGLSAYKDQKGKVPEWSIGAVSKTVVPLRVPRVRIPAFPLKSLKLTENSELLSF